MREQLFSLESVNQEYKQGGKIDDTSNVFNVPDKMNEDHGFG